MIQGPPLSESEYGKRIKELDLLLRLNEKIIRTLDLDEVLQLITDGMAELLEIETAAIYLLEGQKRLYLGATTPPLDPSMPDTIRWAGVDEHPNIKKAIGNLRAHVIADTNEAKLSPAEKQVVEIRKLRSLVFLPIHDEKEVIGILILGTKNKARVYSEFEIELSQGIANQLSLGIVNAKLHTELLQHNDELQQSIKERTEAEEALKASRVELSNALRVAKLAHWEYEVTKDKFIFNDEFYEVMKTSRNKMGGFEMTPENYSYQFIPDEQQKLVREELKKGIDTSDPEFSNEITHSVIFGDGSDGIIVVRYRIIKDENGKTIKIYGANQDITKQKKIEEEILKSRNKTRESEYHFRTLFDLSPEGILLINLDENRIMQMNKAYAEMHGFTCEEMSSVSIFDLDVLGENIFYTRKDLMTRSLNGETVELELEHRHKDGHIFPLKVITQLMQRKDEKLLLCFHQDMTSIKNHEQQLMDALEKEHA